MPDGHPERADRIRAVGHILASPHFAGLLRREAEAALRLLGRMRRLYGPRFFDAITVDGWYVQGPFLKAVDRLGWGWVVVLKQERVDNYFRVLIRRRGEPDK